MSIQNLILSLINKAEDTTENELKYVPEEHICTQ